MLKLSIILTVTILLYTLFTSGCKEVSQKTNTIDSSPQVSGINNTKNDSITSIKSKDSLVSEHTSIAEDTGNVKQKTTRIEETTKHKSQENQKLMAFYFHPTARCETCRNIEAYSIEAINEWEEKSGRKVVWQELNIEDSANIHYTEEYNLEFSSLVIAQYTDGRKDKWKNLEETWKLVNDKEQFKKYVKFELNRFIKNN